MLTDLAWGPKVRERRARGALQISQAVAIGFLLGIRRYWLIPLVITSTFMLLKVKPGDAISFVMDLLAIAFISTYDCCSCRRQSTETQVSGG